MGTYNKLIMPEIVVCLEANDDFLKQRIMNLPESEVMNSHNTEEGLVRRLDAYRTHNTEDETVLNYFDELEFHPEKIGEFIDVRLHCKLSMPAARKSQLVKHSELNSLPTSFVC